MPKSSKKDNCKFCGVCVGSVVIPGPMGVQASMVVHTCPLKEQVGYRDINWVGSDAILV